jgi:predicted kinase
MAPPRPALILMHGVSGSGKSWLSERLIPALPAIRVRSDVERKRLAGVAAGESAATNPAVYSRNFTERTYAHLSECAEACLAAGFATIVDATFLDPAQRAMFLALARRMDIPLTIVACASERQELERRILERAQRGDRVSDADLEVLAAQLRDLQPFVPAEQPYVIHANTSDPDAVADTVAAIRSRLTQP